MVAYQQNLHFKQLFKIIELMGHDWYKGMEHVSFGMVSYEGRALSTREGYVVYLEDLLNKAVEKAREIIEEKSLDNKIPVLSLNELVMEQAEKVKAPCIRPARQKTGSTDFGNVMRHVPGTCIRVAFVPEGAAAHSQEYLDAGKTEAAHNAVVYGAKILALTGAQLIENPEKLEAIKKEFHENLAKELHGQS